MLALALLASGCLSAGVGAPVRSTLDDGQVLMGNVETPDLLLEGALGTLSIPWEDVGEVVPVEGEELAGSGGYVNVWLRNGSELTGHWADAELAMALEVGGRDVGVDVPADKLLRLQTQNGELWPEGLVYRVRTAHGDDFLVDPEASKLVIENEMGVFEPYLSECASAAPLEDPEGDWRIELETGTVLIGPLVHESITFQLPLGPERATVPLELLVSLDRQDWGGAISIPDRLTSYLYDPAEAEMPAAAMPVQAAPRPAAHRTRRAVGDSAVELEALGYLEEQAGSGLMAGEDARDETTTQQPRVDADTIRGAQEAGGLWFDNRRLQEVKSSFY